MLIATPSGIDGLSVEHDVSRDRYAVHGFGVQAELRPWTFGERRRLLQACMTGNELDEARFVTTFVKMLYSPAPPATLSALFAHLALSLFARPEADEELDPLTLAEADTFLARELHILPTQSDLESAPEIDRLIRNLVAIRFPNRKRQKLPVDDAPEAMRAQYAQTRDKTREMSRTTSAKSYATELEKLRKVAASGGKTAVSVALGKAR